MKRICIACDKELGEDQLICDCGCGMNVTGEDFIMNTMVITCACKSNEFFKYEFQESATGTSQVHECVTCGNQLSFNINIGTIEDSK